MMLVLGSNQTDYKIQNYSLFSLFLKYVGDGLSLQTCTGVPVAFFKSTKYKMTVTLQFSYLTLNSFRMFV